MAELELYKIDQTGRIFRKVYDRKYPFAEFREVRSAEDPRFLPGGAVVHERDDDGNLRPFAIVTHVTQKSKKAVEDIGAVPGFRETIRAEVSKAIKKELPGELSKLLELEPPKPRKRKSKQETPQDDSDIPF